MWIGIRKWLLILILALFLLAACTEPTTQEIVVDYSIAPRFREVYQGIEWNEKPILGEVISPLKHVSGSDIEKQYFENGVLVYNPEESPRFYLEVLDMESVPGDAEPLQDEHPPAYQVDGYLILDEFASLYAEHGKRWLGKPTSSTLWNPRLRRFEQYFENFGAYSFKGDSPGVAHFIPYGIQKCADTKCQEDAVIAIPPAKPPTSTPFSELARIAEDRLGYAFAGQVVFGEYQAEDGKRELIFENVVVYADPDSPIGISLRPIARLLGIPTDPLESPIGGMNFRAIEDEKGYNIPGYFDSFINLHSGYELAGEPVTRLQDMGDGVRRQCFTNYCLQYDPYASSQEQVSLLPLGIDYKAIIIAQSPTPIPTSLPAPALPPTPTLAPTQVPPLELGIWVLHYEISSSQSQIFGACAFVGNKPLQNYVADLSVTISSDEKNYHFPASDEGGCTFLTIAPIEKSNGTLIEYQVCITAPWGKLLCEEDSFHIWGNP